MTLDGGADEEGERVGPRQQPVLFPPPFDHQTDVEAQHEGKWHIFPLLAAVVAYPLEHSAEIKRGT